MISYPELCDAIDRWRARMTGDPVDAAPPAPAYAEAAPAYAEPAGGSVEGMMPESVARETTNEIDIDSVDLVDG